MKRSWFIGIDISKKTLDVAIYDPQTKKAQKHFQISNNLKGFKEMINKIKGEGIKLKEAFICMEYCGVYGLELGFYLEKKVDFSFIAPLHIKRSLGLTRGKNDKLDSFKIARFCYLFREELLPTKMPTDIMIKLKTLMSERNRVVKAGKIEKQILKEFNSQLENKAIKRIEQRIKLLSNDLKVIENEILELIKTDTKIEDNYKLLISIVGIGMVNAVMMILCTNNFEGITNARSFACYCGIAPFEYSSGTSIRGKTK